MLGIFLIESREILWNILRISIGYVKDVVYLFYMLRIFSVRYYYIKSLLLYYISVADLADERGRNKDLFGIFPDWELELRAPSQRQWKAELLFKSSVYFGLRTTDRSRPARNTIDNFRIMTARSCRRGWSFYFLLFRKEWLATGP